jgi:hypothetical protein
LLDDALLSHLRAQARERYPAVVCAPASTLTIYVEGHNTDAYDPSVLKDNTGRPDLFLEVALREAVSSKSMSNRLADHHPNLLAVNYALSTDMQLAVTRHQDLGLTLPSVGLGEYIDALACSTIGVNVPLTRPTLKIIEAASDDHPAWRVAIPF